MSDDKELSRLREQGKADRKLLQRAAESLAEIDRGDGLADHNADVLAALRIRLEGRARGSLEDLLSSAGEIAGKRDLGDALGGGGKPASEWPEVKDDKKDWPGL